MGAPLLQHALQFELFLLPQSVDAGIREKSVPWQHSDCPRNKKLVRTTAHKAAREQLHRLPGWRSAELQFGLHDCKGVCGQHQEDIKESL